MTKPRVKMTTVSSVKISDITKSNCLYVESDNNASKTDSEDLPSLIVQYRHRRYISISIDMRTGRTKVREAGYRLGEGDGKQSNSINGRSRQYILRSLFLPLLQ